MNNEGLKCAFVTATIVVRVVLVLLCEGERGFWDGDEVSNGDGGGSSGGCGRFFEVLVV